MSGFEWVTWELGNLSEMVQALTGVATVLLGGLTLFVTVWMVLASQRQTKLQSTAILGLGLEGRPAGVEFGPESFDIETRDRLEPAILVTNAGPAIGLVVSVEAFIEEDRPARKQAVWPLYELGKIDGQILQAHVVHSAVYLGLEVEGFGSPPLATRYGMQSNHVIDFEQEEPLASEKTLRIPLPEALVRKWILNNARGVDRWADLVVVLRWRTLRGGRKMVRRRFHLDVVGRTPSCRTVGFKLQTDNGRRRSQDADIGPFPVPAPQASA